MTYCIPPPLCEMCNVPQPLANCPQTMDTYPIQVTRLVSPIKVEGIRQGRSLLHVSYSHLIDELKITKGQTSICCDEVLVLKHMTSNRMKMEGKANQASCKSCCRQNDSRMHSAYVTRPLPNDGIMPTYPTL